MSETQRLPAAYVERIFQRLTVRYGRDFLSKYEGIDMTLVAADWAEVLGGFADMPEAIKYGLAYLPNGRPPSATEFRDICRKSPREGHLALGHSFSRTPEADKAMADVMKELALRMKRAKA